MTLLVRNEEDIVDEQLRYHLEHGVDFVIATDHRSVDGTTEILRRYEREGLLHYIADQRAEYLQAENVNRMARLAATDFDADWVINADADEFWWPRDGSFAEIFESVPTRFGVVLGFCRHFVLRPDDDEPFFERMIWRRRPRADWTTPYFPYVVVAHRAHARVDVMKGNHKVLTESLPTLREWLPIEVLHFPVRSSEQLERKFTRASRNAGPHWQHASEELRGAGVKSIVARLLVDDTQLEAGLADRSFTLDTRVRDALRSSGTGSSAVAHALSIDDDAALASEFGDPLPVASCAELAPRVDELSARMSAIDGGRTA